jgi:hypothetical protein
MDSDRLNKLRAFYHSILEQQRLLAGLDLKGSMNIVEAAVLPLINEFEQLNLEFRDLVPPFDPSKYSFVSGLIGDRYYNYVGVLSYASMVLGRLKIFIEESLETPVTETRRFAFISDTNIRKIVERDYDEIQRAYISKCWKSVIILCGGTIEAILTDLLICHDTEAKQAKSAPNKPDISRWDLSELINVAVELKLVTESVEKLSHSIREYRNLVHPGNEIRNKLHFDAEEAKISLEVLNILHRNLSK